AVGKVVGVDDAIVAVAGSGVGGEALPVICENPHMVNARRVKTMNPPIIQIRELERGFDSATDGSAVGVSNLWTRGGSGVMILASGEEASGKTPRKAFVNSAQVL